MNSRNLDLGVLGGGPWGLSLAKAAQRAGCKTTLFSRRKHDDAAGIALTHSLAELCRARLILFAVPSNLARGVGRELGDHLDGGHIVVHGIRGLSVSAGSAASGDSDLVTVSQILREETPTRRLGALGGPVQADELHEGRPSALVVGSEFADVTAATAQALRSERLEVRESRDLRGLEWASALVGCLSIGLGYVQARKAVAPGLLAALISRAVDEAAAIAAAAGADERTFYGLGGYGDLLASMALPNRPEVAIGRELAGGASLDQARRKAGLRVEAVDLVPRITRFSKLRGVRCDIFVALAAILEGVADPESAVRALFAT